MKLNFHSICSILFASAGILLAACSTAPEAVRVPVLSPEQKAYQVMPRAERIAYFADGFKRREMQSAGYYPLSVKVDLPYKTGMFQVEETPDTVLAGKKYDFGKISVIAPPYVLVSVKDGKVELTNLKIATRYDWVMRSGIKPEQKGAFETEDMAPRLMKINGVPNVRDLGGRIGLDGCRVRQGLIYRTAGLNNNASVKPLTREEFAKLKDEKAQKRVAAYDEENARLQKRLDAGIKDLPYLPYTLDNEWTVFRPSVEKVSEEDWAKAGAMTEIPASFLGGKAQKIQTDAKGIFQFPGYKAYRPALFMKVFDSPTAGTMQVGCGADWFMRVYLNGKIVYDILEEGSPAYPIETANHPMNIPIKQGRNILVIPMLSGSASFTFCFGKLKQMIPEADMVKAQIRQNESRINYVLSHNSKAMIPGKNRLDAATASYLVNDLRVRSDIDLRSDGECFGMTGSPAGSKVTWYHYSSSAYAGMQTDNGKEAFSKVFRVFLDEDNYPVVFHCIAGQDRTGAVAFILNGLLGVEEEQLYLDWESTGYWNPSASFNHKNLFDKLVQGFDKFPGKTLNERIEAYVLSIGFTKKDIEHFRNIMLEK